MKLSGQRMEEEARVTELEDLLNSNLLKRHQELTQQLQEADVEADRCAHVVLLLLLLPCLC